MTKEFRFLVIASLAHLPLGLAVYYLGFLSLVHPLVVFGVGLYWAANRKFRLERVALVIAYLIGSEVLWRMAQVPVFWEVGKYGSALIAIIALLRRGKLNIPKLPVLYFALLIPGCLLTINIYGLAAARGILSFNMSGPFFLAIACWFFACTRFSTIQLRQLLLTVLVPLLSVAFATLFFTVTNDEIQFTGESNFATSGGFGPNQVSSMLGMGLFVAVALLLIFRNSVKYQAYLLLTASFFAAQSVMTFSRGGIYNAVGAIIVISIIQLRDPSQTAKRLIPIAGLVILFFALLFPVLNDFTGGRLEDRFQDTGGTNRVEIVESDFYLFMTNPVLGVGVGEARLLRAQFLGRSAASHTEFARLLSEHGLFGIAALLLLVAMGFSNFMRQRSLAGRALVAGAGVWCCLFMLNSGMRLAAPSFLWGLTFLTIGIQRQIPMRVAKGSAGRRIRVGRQDVQPNH